MKCQFCSGTIYFSKLVLCDSVQLLYCIYLQECLLIVNKSVLLLLIMVYIMYSKLIQTMFTFPVTSVSSSKKYFIWTLCFGWDFIRVHRMTSGDIVCGAQRVGINALQHWNSLFNYTMSYKLDSDIRYVYAKIIVDTKFQDGYDLKKNCLEVKQKNAIILVSNCHKDHLNLLQSVKKHIDVNIYGNYGKRCIPPHAIKCFSYIPMYEFYLAFENSICQGYLTRSNNHKSSNERSN